MQAQFDPELLNRMYNNRALVPDHAAYTSRWAQTSAVTRASGNFTLDVRYGPGPNTRLDIFRPENGMNSSVLFFIHGGYWRSMDKAEHAFIAREFIKSNVCVVIPNYALCPDVTIPEIVSQIEAALEWTICNIGRHGGNPNNITAVGHSAGGHLAAILLAAHRERFSKNSSLRKALAISGMYDLEAIMHAPYLQDTLNITPSQVAQCSPALLAPKADALLNVVVGGLESAEFLRHSRLIQEAWGRGKVPISEVLEGHNHFSVLDSLADPASRLHQLAMDLLEQT